MSKYLSAAEILQAEDLDYRDVEVKEWGGTVRLKALSAAEVLQFVDAVADPIKKKSANGRLVAMSAVNDQGERIFTEDQLEALHGKNVRILNMLAEQAMLLNGLSVDKKAAEAKVEEAKNV